MKNLYGILLSASLFLFCTACGKLSSHGIFSAKSEDKEDSSPAALQEEPDKNKEAGAPKEPQYSPEELAKFEGKGFLSLDELKKPENVYERHREEVEKFLQEKPYFLNPFHSKNTSELEILDKDTCPEKLWENAVAKVHEKHLLVIDIENSYNCHVAPSPTDTLQNTLDSEVKGRYYYFLKCEQTDLSEFHDKPVKDLISGIKPQLCTDDPSKEEMLQYKMEVVSLLSYLLFTVEPVQVKKDAVLIFASQTPDGKPCKITHADELFQMSGCAQTHINYQTYYKRTRNDQVVSEITDQIVDTFENVAYEGVVFDQEGKWYQTGEAKFTKAGWEGVITFSKEASPKYEASSLKAEVISGELK